MAQVHPEGSHDPTSAQLESPESPEAAPRRLPPIGTQDNIDSDMSAANTEKGMMERNEQSEQEECAKRIETLYNMDWYSWGILHFSWMFSGIMVVLVAYANSESN